MASARPLALTQSSLRATAEVMWTKIFIGATLAAVLGTDSRG